jgi:hypothetical protein
VWEGQDNEKEKRNMIRKEKIIEEGLWKDEERVRREGEGRRRMKIWRTNERIWGRMKHGISGGEEEPEEEEITKGRRN